MAQRVAQVARDHEAPGHPALYDYGPVQLKAPVLSEYSKSWWSLKERILKRARPKCVALKGRAWFRRADTRSSLDRLLGDMMTFCGGAAIRRLAPTERIFRARSASSREEALEWLKASSDCHIRAPKNPPLANRMNAASTRAFYGALQERIAVAEVQPSIGGYLLVGAFAPTRPIAVLDLGALGDVFDHTGLFDPEFDVVLQRLAFLRMLEREISLPIQPAEEPVGYIPTQVVAEYIHTVLGLDGLAYRSTQMGEAPPWPPICGARQEPTERNVVLFGGAALTAEEGTPEVLEPRLRLLPESRRACQGHSDQDLLRTRSRRSLRTAARPISSSARWSNSVSDSSTWALTRSTSERRSVRASSRNGPRPRVRRAPTRRPRGAVPRSGCGRRAGARGPRARRRCVCAAGQQRVLEAGERRAHGDHRAVLSPLVRLRSGLQVGLRGAGAGPGIRACQVYRPTIIGVIRYAERLDAPAGSRP